jgi:hypothetical protein
MRKTERVRRIDQLSNALISEQRTLKKNRLFAFISDAQLQPSKFDCLIAPKARSACYRNSRGRQIKQSPWVDRAL